MTINIVQYEHLLKLLQCRRRQRLQTRTRIQKLNVENRTLYDSGNS